MGKKMPKIDFVVANTGECLAEVEKIYMEAFPAIERKPFSMLVDAQAKGNVEILMVMQSQDGQGTKENQADIIGEMILAQYADVVLLDYFAISCAFRGHGIGAQVLGKLRERCEKKRLILEIESTKVAADNFKQRLSRKAFYKRCGMRALDYSVLVMGVEMEVLTFGCEVGFEEYHAVYEQVFGEEIGAKIQRIG
ncbi:MAG: hypothetical protein K2N63_11440 [Lachnospiraceae bacterium]|nr:hypothetical protein [Lachnospiraceae bacterium]